MKLQNIQVVHLLQKQDHQNLLFHQIVHTVHTVHITETVMMICILYKNKIKKGLLIKLQYNV